MLAKNNGSRWRPVHKNQTRLQFPSQGHSAYFEGVGKRHYSKIYSKVRSPYIESPQFQQNVSNPRIFDKNYEQFSTQLTPRVRKKAQIGQSSAREHEDSLELFKRNYHMKLARDQDLDYLHNNNAKSNKTYILNLEDYNIDNKNKPTQSNQQIVHKQNPYLNINLGKKQKRDRDQKQISHHQNSPTYHGSYKNILNPMEQLYQMIHKNDKNEQSEVGNYQTIGNEKDQGKIRSPTYISSKLGI